MGVDAAVEQQSAALTGVCAEAGRADASLALSWSGGKDSALTLLALRDQGVEPGALIPPACTNGTYEARMAQALQAPPLGAVETVAFGVLFLQDIRAYRESRLAAG